VKFKQETQFQDTEIGKIPREWRVKKLGELALETYYGLTAKAVNQPTGLRMLRTTDIKDNYRVNWDSLPYCEITDNRRSNIQKYLLRKNDLVVSRAGTTGMSILVDKDFNDVIFGSYLIKIKLNESVAYPKFIHYFMQSSLYWNQLLPKQAGSTLKNISLPILKNILTPLPPINEQKLIPEILSTVDRAIEVVDAGVVRLEGLKKALMRELLTGRIRVREENGKTIFYREAEFQDTEIGKIPREWKIKRLGHIVKYVKGKKPSVLFDERLSEEFVPYLTAEYMRGLDRPKWCNTKLESNVIRVSRDDIIMIWDGSYSGHVFTGFDGALASTMVKITPIVELDKKFLYYYLLANFEKFRSTTVGTGIPHVNKKVFEEFPIPVPPLHEQVRIAGVLSTVDRAIELYREERIKLDRLKRGLMDLLLTGKIRVVED
jgi:type I restriction enzyme S subunit